MQTLDNEDNKYRIFEPRYSVRNRALSYGAGYMLLREVAPDLRIRREGDGREDEGDGVKVLPSQPQTLTNGAGWHRWHRSVIHRLPPMFDRQPLNSIPTRTYD